MSAAGFDTAGAMGRSDVANGSRGSVEARESAAAWVAAGGCGMGWMLVALIADGLMARGVEEPAPDDERDISAGPRPTSSASIGCSSPKSIK